MKMSLIENIYFNLRKEIHFKPSIPATLGNDNGGKKCAKEKFSSFGEMTHL